MKKAPAANIDNIGSLKTLKSTNFPPVLGGSLVSIVKQAKINRATVKNPAILTPHSKPIEELNVLFSTIGYIKPPIELPVANTPKAVALLVEKKCEIEEAAGKKSIPAASLTRQSGKRKKKAIRECERAFDFYSLHMLILVIRIFLYTL